ncbi:MAG: antitoxin [Chlorobium sp.]|nr:MAG: antitoxin [Chlorobium sp.]
MYDKILLLEKLVQIEKALGTIERRFSSIKTVDDFLDSNQGMDMLDGIAMMLIAVGENFKTIDSHTKGALFDKYPHINCSGVKGLRDILAH